MKEVYSTFTQSFDPTIKKKRRDLIDWSSRRLYRQTSDLSRTSNKNLRWREMSNRLPPREFNEQVDQRIDTTDLLKERSKCVHEQNSKGEKKELSFI